MALELQASVSERCSCWASASAQQQVFLAASLIVTDCQTGRGARLCPDSMPVVWVAGKDSVQNWENSYEHRLACYLVHSIALVCAIYFGLTKAAALVHIGWIWPAFMCEVGC